MFPPSFKSNRPPSRFPSGSTARKSHKREGDDGSHLRFVAHWYPYTRRYSPKLLEVTPFRFISDPALGKAVAHLKEINRDQRRKLTTEAPIGILPRRWAK